jgi:cell division protein FtsN
LRERKPKGFRPWGWVSLVLFLIIVALLVVPVIRHSLRTAERLEHRTTLPRVARAHPEPTPATVTRAEKTFSFYTQLKKRFEIVLPEEERSARTDHGRHPIVHPGRYLIQVGSFRHWQRANQLKAKLALWGIVAQINPVRISNGERWDRVQIGPIERLNHLNTLRRLLSRHRVTMLLIRLNPPGRGAGPPS